jgi:hypothetical protein
MKVAESVMFYFGLHKITDDRKRQSLIT